MKNKQDQDLAEAVLTLSHQVGSIIEYVRSKHKGYNASFNDLTKQMSLLNAIKELVESRETEVIKAVRDKCFEMGVGKNANDAGKAAWHGLTGE